MHFLSSLVYVLTTLGILVIALITLVRRQGAGTIYFSGLCFAAVVWLLLQYLAQLVGGSNPLTGLHLVQGASLVSNVMVYAFLLFVLNFIEIDAHRFKLVKFLAILPPLCFAVASFSSYMIQETVISSRGIAIEEAGPLYILQLISFTLYLLISLVLLFVSTIKKPARLRTPNYLLLIALGQAVFFIMLTSTVFAANASSQLIIPLSIFAMVSVVSIAIVRHKLFDIRPIIAKAIAYILLAVTIGGTFSVVIFWVTNAILGERPSGIATSVYILAALILAFAFQPLKKVFGRATNKFFYQDAYDSQQFFNNLNQVLVSTVDLEVLINRTLIIISSNLKVEYAAVYLKPTENSGPRLLGINLADENVKKGQIQHLSSSSTFHDNPVIVADYLTHDQEELKWSLSRNNIALIARLSSASTQSHNELGYVVLGPKKSGNPFSSQDAEVIEAAANELLIAIQNALRFEQIEQFNETLQEKIDEATRQLRRTNDKLRKLDETKDDFISMASHQLRTPLTSVKGYVSMVLDGDAGKISGLQRKLLTQSFISSQRMVYLISDLLNVSRLKTGKFIIEPTPTNLARVIDEEIEQLQETAKGRNLQLTYHKPEHFPVLMMDETKIRQVIMNFIDNAVYYTPSGGHITVNLVDNPQTIDFTVVDDGIGVPRHEQHHLFTKFFRAHNAKRARPDGTGLGLFMAKKVIIAQGGAIIFKSQEGRGSTFGFTFSKQKLGVASQKPSPASRD